MHFSSLNPSSLEETKLHFKPSKQEAKSGFCNEDDHTPWFARLQEFLEKSDYSNGLKLVGRSNKVSSFRGYSSTVFIKNKVLLSTRNIHLHKLALFCSSLFIKNSHLWKTEGNFSSTSLSSQTCCGQIINSSWGSVRWYFKNMASRDTIIIVNFQKQSPQGMIA